MFRFESGEHGDSFHCACVCVCAPAGVYLRKAFSTRERRKWILGKCSGGVLITAALGADQDIFFIMDPKHTHFYLCTRSHLSADNINAVMVVVGGLISINTDIKRLAGVTGG